MFVDRQCVQLAAFPILIDPPPAGQAGGIVLVGMTWLKTDLERILDLSGVQIALFQEGMAVLSTGVPFSREPIAYEVAGNPPRSIWQIATQAPTLAQVNHERFLLLQVPVNGRDEFSQLSRSFNRMVAGLRERDYIRNTFGRYIDAQVARELLQRPETAALGGEKRDVPIIMCDIRGFTAICQELSPAATLSWLNAYFSHMLAVINKHHGIIIDFVSDAVLLFFDPLEGTLAKAAGRAVRCAFDMQQQVAIFNAEIDTTLLPETQIGIGINAGSVIVGNIGSEDRRKYGIVGSAVNITQRIQEHAGAGEIVASKALLAQARKDLRVVRRFEAPLKGIREPVTLYTIVPADAASGKVEIRCL